MSGEDTERAIHERVSTGNCKMATDGGIINARGFETFIVTEVDIGKLDKGFKNGEPW